MAGVLRWKLWYGGDTVSSTFIIVQPLRVRRTSRRSMCGFVVAPPLRRTTLCSSCGLLPSSSAVAPPSLWLTPGSSAYAIHGWFTTLEALVWGGHREFNSRHRATPTNTANVPTVNVWLCRRASPATNALVLVVRPPSEFTSCHPAAIIWILRDHHLWLGCCVGSFGVGGHCELNSRRHTTSAAKVLYPSMRGVVVALPLRRASRHFCLCSV